jgi:dihydrofolate reductase
MRIAIVVATDLDGIIGRDGRLPWHLPADLRHFKRLTMGKPMIMGRKTYESIGKALPGRTSIVLSRQAGFEAPGCLVASTTEQALALAAGASAELGIDETMVIGGEAVFREFLPRAERVYWTEVQAHVGGDVRFPRLEPGEWLEMARTDLPADAENPWSLRFRTLVRQGPVG